MRVRARHIPGEMNKTELAYAQHLDSLIAKKEIKSYEYEPESLKIGPMCRYTPDFRVLRRIPNTDDFLIEFHEVKAGRDKPFVEDDALVKIKAAAHNHPYKFLITWKHKGEWLVREIN